jgi:predicted nucleotidyltransferase
MILQHGFNVRSMRATVDIDFAVQLEHWKQFAHLKQTLMEEYGFTETKELHRLISADGLPVDIVPYGGLAENNIVSWPPDQSVKKNRTM